MNIPYTYRIYCIPTNQYYYGVRYAKNCNPSDLWVSYFTSSNNVKMLIETYGKDQFKFEIRKIFPDNETAIKWEERVTKKVLYWSNYLNANSGRAFNHSKSTNGGATAFKLGVGIHALTSTERSANGKKGSKSLGARKMKSGLTENEKLGNARGIEKAVARRSAGGWTEKEKEKYTEMNERRLRGDWTEKELAGYAALTARRQVGHLTDREIVGRTKQAEYRRNGKWITNGVGNKFTIEETPPVGWCFGFTRKK